MRFELDFSKALGPAALRKIRKRWAAILLEQVLDRIENGGDEEIRFAPLAFNRIDGSKDRPLYRNGSHLHTSITSGVSGNAVWCGSTMKGSRVLQRGTKGKSAEGVGQGKNPTIVPVRAKALFIPLTARAQNSVRVHGPPVRRIVKPSFRTKKPKPVGELVRGEDFILVSKVDLPPRPFLRLTKANKQELADVLRGK